LRTFGADTRKRWIPLLGAQLKAGGSAGAMALLSSHVSLLVIRQMLATHELQSVARRNQPRVAGARGERANRAHRPAERAAQVDKLNQRPATGRQVLEQPLRAVRLSFLLLAAALIAGAIAAIGPSPGGLYVSLLGVLAGTTVVVLALSVRRAR
jgi:hypothetical protein